MADRAAVASGGRTWLVSRWGGIERRSVGDAMCARGGDYVRRWSM